MPARRRVHLLLLTGLAAGLAGTALLALSPPPAGAAVTHLDGFEATVDGFTSWYGSYGMGPLGVAWCIDHGIRAPDPAFAYVAADLSAVPASTQAAMAWVVSAHGQGTDPVDHAAVMLVLHDLMGAVYPSGPLDVDALPLDRLAGFDGHEADVLVRARWLKADGLNHQELRGPLRLGLAIAAVIDGQAAVTVTVVDAGGRPLVGISVHLSAPAGALTASDGTTDSTGHWHTTARPAALPLTVLGSATVPSPVLDAWSPTTQPAQRVARPRLDELSASATLAAAPTTTTTTTVPPTTTTTTTVPPTTTTTTTVLPTTVPPTTTSAPTSTTAAAVAASTTTTPAPSAMVALPRTGASTVALGLIALGLLLVGVAALDIARGGAWHPRVMGHHGRDGTSARH